jgi:RNA polymerase sigma-70 factor, ECF subfamily
VAGLASLARRIGLRQRPTTVNGQLGAVYIDADGRLINVVALDITEDGVSAVHSIVNPDKLRHLGPVGDVSGLMRRRE